MLNRIFIGSQSRELEKRASSKDERRAAPLTVVLDTQQGTLCRALRASRRVCLPFLIFCKHLEGRDGWYVVIPWASPYTAQGTQKHRTKLLWLHTQAGLGLSAAEPHKLSHLPHCFSRQQKLRWPRAMEHWSYQLPSSFGMTIPGVHRD